MPRFPRGLLSVANSSQARKRARQAEDRRQRNAGARSRMRTTVKKTKQAVLAGDKALAATLFKAAEPVIDAAIGKGLIHKNTAARTKSRLNASIRALD